MKEKDISKTIYQVNDIDNKEWKKRSSFNSRMLNRKNLPYAIAVLQGLFAYYLIFSQASITTKNTKNESTVQTVDGNKIQFHNGGFSKEGSCWCTSDVYCVCTPFMAIDLVIQDSHEDYVWVVRRRDTSQLGVMGGFSMIGETAEESVVRELVEETGILVSATSLSLLGVYSDPNRDKRRHTTSAVYLVQLPEGATPKPADDVKDVIRITLSEVESLPDVNFFADHKTILMDYKYRDMDRAHLKAHTSVRGVTGGYSRSVCSRTDLVKAP